MKDYRQLNVWREAFRLVFTVYNATKKFPKDAAYGFIAPIRYAVGSIPSNLAEGCWRGSDAELVRFSVIAMGFAAELQSHLLLAHDLNFLDDKTYNHLNIRLREVRELLHFLVRRLKKANL